MRPTKIFLASSLGFLASMQVYSAMPPAKADPSLQISRMESQETVGTFQSPAGKILFASSESAPGITAQVSLGTITLEAVEDTRSGVAWMDGHGFALNLEQRSALLALTEALAKSWDGEIQRAGLAKHRQFLFRHLLYWSDAPIGLPLRRLEIKIDPQPWNSTESDSAEDFDSSLEFLEGSDSLQRIASCISFTSTCPVARGNCETGWSLPCKKGNCSTGKTCYRCDNKRAYLSGCNYQSVANICHDADNNGHCYDCETLTVGCNKNTNCVGRCGPGCGPSSCPSTDGKDGEGTYTFDCAEHDKCCGDHGGCLSGTASSNCGDEYAEAYDDTIYGTCSCTGCFNP